MSLRTLIIAGSWAALLLATPSAAEDAVEYLVPEMEGNGLHMETGERPYLNRLAFTPAGGTLGNDAYYSLRLAFNPSRYFGYEAHVGHNPAESVHALVNSVHALLRYPLPGRAQPYATAGYGMMFIFPGSVFKADPVTKNLLAAGLGLELYIREDVALRTEIRGLRLMGGSTSTSGDDSFGYRELSVGLSFYRNLTP